MKNLIISSNNILIKGIISIILLGFAYVGLISGVPFGFLFLITAGIIGTIITFGIDGLKSVFGPFKGKGVLLTLIIGYISSFILALGSLKIGRALFHVEASANSAADAFKHASIGTILKQFALMTPALAGEEILVILPLLIIATLIYKEHKGNSKSAIVIATIITAIMFGALHLPAYKGNLYQSLICIGLARVPFTIASLKHDTIWSGIIIHIVYDFSIFLLVAVR